MISLVLYLPFLPFPSEDRYERPHEFPLYYIYPSFPFFLFPSEDCYMISLALYLPFLPFPSLPLPAEDRYERPHERLVLPTAPRTAREPDVDPERVPRDPPFTAYIANLPFEVDDDDITRFFQDLKVCG